MVWSAGAVLTAAQLNTYAPQAWSTYTPTWTGTTTNPALGNGTITGRYIAIGKTTVYYIDLAIGSTTTFGSGRWEFTLPSSPIGYADGFTIIGDALARDSGTRNYSCDAIYTSPNRVHVWRDAGASESTITPTTPMTWASGDRLAILGVYEAA